MISMNNLLYIIAGILIIMWVIGFIGFHSTWGHVFVIHYLLLIAAIAIIIRLVRLKTPVGE